MTLSAAVISEQIANGVGLRNAFAISEVNLNSNPCPSRRGLERLAFDGSPNGQA
jgi:hypothetical protein